MVAGFFVLSRRRPLTPGAAVLSAIPGSEIVTWLDLQCVEGDRERLDAYELIVAMDDEFRSAIAERSS